MSNDMSWRQPASARIIAQCVCGAEIVHTVEVRPNDQNPAHVLESFGWRWTPDGSGFKSWWCPPCVKKNTPPEVVAYNLQREQYALAMERLASITESSSEALRELAESAALAAKTPNRPERDMPPPGPPDSLRTT